MGAKTPAVMPGRNKGRSQPAGQEKPHTPHQNGAIFSHPPTPPKTGQPVQNSRRRAALDRQAQAWANAAKRALRLIPAEVIQVEHTTEPAAHRVRITANWQDQPTINTLRLQALLAAYGGRPEALIDAERIEITRHWPTI